jgi:tetratricopeptide (TPR) repeat protein
MSDSKIKINLFVSYSHDDVDYYKVFSDRLKKVAINTEHFEWSIWDDTKIYAGTFWDDEIQNNIKECNVALLLVSVGFMASKYIKEKEFNEFTKRYADKGILIVPIVFKPCDFNRWEDLGKLQFFKPSGSEYQKADIKDFTYADLIKFRDTDGTLNPNPNIDRYHLDLAKKVEDSYKEFLKRKETFEILEIPLAQKPASINVNTLSDYPKPSNLFTGRLAKIEEFKNTIEGSRIFAIEGLGGTGKTQFAAKCIEDIIEDKNRVIWLNGSSQSNFDVFVESAGYGDVLKGQKKTDLALYSGFKDLLERDERIIFWDNFNDYEDKTFYSFLSFANQYFQKTRVILITKIDPSIDKVTSLPIIRLEGLDTDAIEYALKFKDTNPKYNSISSEDLEKICAGVEGHPLAIEFSMYLMGYGKTADDILLHMPEYSGMKKVEEFSKRLFLDIFSNPNTTQEERDCFLKCSVFKERIAEEEIKFLYDEKDVFHLLAGLIDKLLLKHKNGYFEMHPLVRSFSYEMLENKKSIHKKAADYFIASRIDVLNAGLEEKIFYHLSEADEWEIIADFIERLGNNFIIQGQSGLVKEIINKLKKVNISRPIFDIFCGDIAQVKSEWNEAILSFRKASQNENDICIRTQGLIKYGEILLRRGDNKEALPYFETGYRLAKDNLLPKEEARALNDIGLVYYDFGELDIAYEKFSLALKIREIIGNLEDIATSYNNISLIFGARNQFLKSSEFLNKSISFAKKDNNKIAIALYYTNMANYLRQQNKLDEALSKCVVSLNIFEEIGDKAGICNCTNMIGLIYCMQGNNEDGLIKYNESLKIGEEIGSKRSISVNLINIGTVYFDKKEYLEALYYYFHAFSISSQIGNKFNQNHIYENVNVILDSIGRTKFKELANQAYYKLEIKDQKSFDLKDFFNEPHVRDIPKVGRNESCPCGSLKKYKNCHGAN